MRWRDGATGLLALLLGACTPRATTYTNTVAHYTQRGHTHAEATYHSFPTTIPGAESVTVKEAPADAQHILIHIRQKHPTHEMTEEEQRIAGIPETQQDILTITQHLVKQHIITHVHQEGVTQEYLGGLKFARMLYNDGTSSPFAYQTDRTRIKQQLEKQGGPILGTLYLTHKIDVLPAEDDETFAKATEAVQRNDYTGHAVMEEREHALIHIIAEEQHPIDAAIYGGRHNFGRAIREHNEKHPSNKIALIEVTPTHHQFNRCGEGENAKKHKALCAQFPLR